MGKPDTSLELMARTQRRPQHPPELGASGSERTPGSAEAGTPPEVRTRPRFPPSVLRTQHLPEATCTRTSQGKCSHLLMLGGAGGASCAAAPPYLRVSHPRSTTPKNIKWKIPETNNSCL